VHLVGFIIIVEDMGSVSSVYLFAIAWPCRKLTLKRWCLCYILVMSLQKCDEWGVPPKREMNSPYGQSPCKGKVIVTGFHPRLS
jgi:hypothetical protein